LAQESTSHGKLPPWNCRGDAAETLDCGWEAGIIRLGIREFGSTLRAVEPLTFCFLPLKAYQYSGFFIVWK
jgi:hypothetical protein